MSLPDRDDPVVLATRRGFGSGLSLPRIAVRTTKTLLSLAVTLFGLLLVTFAIGRLVPIDPVLAIVGERATQAQYEAVRTDLGLDRPLPVQFAIYVSDVVQGDFGRSNLTSRPVLTDIARTFPATLELATLATLVGVLVGVPFGVISAENQGRWPDQTLRVIGLLGYSMPVFWLGLIALLVFYGILGWTGGPGQLDVSYELSYELDVTAYTGSILVDTALSGAWDVFANALSHIVLPVAVLGYFSLAYISRMTRSFMLEQLGQEYVTAARVKGVPEWRVVWVHALGNAMVPLITVIALSYAALLEGSVLTETVFAWPGLGLYITQALFAADLNAVLGGTVVIGVVFITLNLLSDLLYTLVDPEGPMSAAGTKPAGWRAWLTTDTPRSRLQARMIGLWFAWAELRGNLLAMVGLGIVALLVLMAVFAPLIATDPPNAQDLAGRLQPPGTDGHILGTDELGRDIWSRIVYGSRVTLYVVALVALTAPVFGLIVGTAAGAMGGWVDRVLMRMTDIFLAFPRLILALAFVAALGPGIVNAIFAIALTAWPPYARVARAETLTVRNSDYIAAARLQGAGTFRIITGHIMPMCIASVIIRVTLDMAGIILTAAGLGFLGLGAQPPLAEWGAMISSGRQYLLSHWWVATVPGVAILLVSLGFNLLGDSLRDVLDPRGAQK